MSTDSSPESLIEAALDQAFSPPPLRKQAPGPSTHETGKDGHEVVNQSQTHEETSSDTTGASNVSVDTWRAGYDKQVRAWHAESAEARARAEEERARWEAIRAAEKEEAARRKSEPQESEWESVTEKKDERSASVPDVPDPIPGTFERQDEHAQGESTDESQKWEDIHSSETSSFPSMSFPERTATPSPSPPARYDTLEPPRTATSAIFDPSLSTRTRLKALFASLAINLFLPFVNGVMLGFGEIFAKEVVIGWFGWGMPGSTVGSRGIRTWLQRRWRS